MPDGGDSLTVRLVERIGDVDPAAWDACAGTRDPFVSHAFLHALEEGGSATAETGWLPQHLIAEDARGRIAGVVPMYLKGHSYGEYVFDQGWADAYRRAGGRYYPKLQVAVPFTPVTGRRILVAAHDDGDAVRATMAAALPRIARRARVSSLHVTFCTKEEAAVFSAAGFLIRRGFQYHWDNQSYGSFDDFLARLSHSKRKAIRKERREVAAQGFEILSLTGKEITPAHWDAYHDLYVTIFDRKWGAPYLTRAFFHRLGETLADRVLLVLARHGGRFVAGALNLIGDDTLYGRNWGALGEFRFLHFEACYYRAIDFAIARGLKRVEAGAQGEHKVQRGYLPQPTYSAHWIRDEAFRDAVARFVERETVMIGHEMAEIAQHSPFKADDTG